jgi:hypothetical protein
VALAGRSVLDTSGWLSLLEAAEAVWRGSSIFAGVISVWRGRQAPAAYFYLSLSTSVETRPAQGVIRVPGRGIALIRGKICASRVETAPAGPCSKLASRKAPGRPPRKPCHIFVKVRPRYINHLKRICDTASYHTVWVAARAGRQPTGESVNFL